MHLVPNIQEVSNQNQLLPYRKHLQWASNSYVPFATIRKGWDVSERQFSFSAMKVAAQL